MKKLANGWKIMLAAVLGVGCGPITVDVGDLPDGAGGGAPADGGGELGTGGDHEVPIDPGFDGNAGGGARANAGGTGGATLGGGGNSGRSSGSGGLGAASGAGGAHGTLEQPGTFESVPSANGCEGLETNWILFDSDRADGERHVFAMRSDGSGTLELAGPGEDPAISPDGTTLVYVVDGALVARALPNGAVTPLDITGDQPAWSPDGSLLAYHADNGIQILHFATLTSRTLVACASCRNGGYQHPEFVADGSAVVVDRENEIDRVELATGFSEYIVRNWTITMSHPTVSPEGSDVVATLEAQSLWLSPYAEVVNPGDGTRLTPASEQATSPVWGRDDWIAYEHLGEDGERDIELGNVGVHARCLIGGAGDDANPTWAPDGFDPGGIAN